jgi:hypothetical protein
MPPFIDSTIIGLFYWGLAGDAAEVNDASLVSRLYIRIICLRCLASYDYIEPHPRKSV